MSSLQINEQHLKHANAYLAPDGSIVITTDELDEITFLMGLCESGQTCHFKGNHVNLPYTDNIGVIKQLPSETPDLLCVFSFEEQPKRVLPPAPVMPGMPLPADSVIVNGIYKLNKETYKLFYVLFWEGEQTTTGILQSVVDQLISYKLVKSYPVGKKVNINLTVDGFKQARIYFHDKSNKMFASNTNKNDQIKELRDELKKSQEDRQHLIASTQQLRDDFTALKDSNKILAQEKLNLEGELSGYKQLCDSYDANDSKFVNGILEAVLESNEYQEYIKSIGAQVAKSVVVKYSLQDGRFEFEFPVLVPSEAVKVFTYEDSGKIGQMKPHTIDLTLAGDTDG